MYNEERLCIETSSCLPNRTVSQYDSATKSETITSESVSQQVHLNTHCALIYLLMSLFECFNLKSHI